VILLFLDDLDPSLDDVDNYPLFGYTRNDIERAGKIIAADKLLFAGDPD